MDNHANATSYAQKLMSLLSGSPEVKVILDRERRQVEAAEKQARLDCLVRVKAAELEVAKSQQKLDLATASVAAAEAVLAEAKAKLAPVFNAHTETQRKYSLAATELATVHGEGVVSQTLYRLQRLILKTEGQISDLEAGKKTTFLDVDGRWSFRPVSPNVAHNQQVLKQRLAVQKQLYEKAKQFVEAEMAPSELTALCGQICETIGQPLQVPEATE